MLRVPIHGTNRENNNMKRILVGLMAALLGGLGALGLQGESASAASAPPQCNGEMNTAGLQVACTVVVDNYIAAGGGLAETPASTLTMTRCVGPSGPVSTLTCDTTIITLSAPVTVVQQCNDSGSGGGGTVRCSVTIRNHFVGSVPESLRPRPFTSAWGPSLRVPALPEPAPRRIPPA